MEFPALMLTKTFDKSIYIISNVNHINHILFCAKMYAWIVVSCCLFFIIETASGQCVFNLETPLASKTPIVLMNGLIIDPNNRNGDVTLSNGQKIQFLCSGPGNYLVGCHLGPLENATCLNNHFLLESNGNTYNFANLRCRKPPQPQATEIGRCNLQSKKIHLGFQVNPTKLLPLVELCFDANNLITYWSKHLLGYSPYSCQISDTTSFKKDFFTDVNPETIYGRYSQYDRGHLTPKCDFFSGPAKRMTFYYVNAAPQISQFNQENWRDLEGVIRTSATQSHKSLYIYTGTHHTVQYLSDAIPVPLYFWKAVIDGSNGNGVAFVGINNIQQNVASPCQEIQCDRLSWLSRSFISRTSNVNKGRIYCCSIQSLQGISNIQLPEFSEFQGGLLRSL